MLTLKDRKKIRLKLNNIYKVSLSKKDISDFEKIIAYAHFAIDILKEKKEIQE